MVNFSLQVIIGGGRTGKKHRRPTPYQSIWEAHEMVCNLLEIIKIIHNTFTNFLM